MIQTLNDWSLFLNGSTVVVGRKYQLASSRKYESTKGTKMLDVLLDLGQVRSGQDNMSTCQHVNMSTKEQDHKSNRNANIKKKEQTQCGPKNLNQKSQKQCAVS